MKGVEGLWWKLKMVDRWWWRRRHSMPKMCKRCCWSIRRDAQRQKTRRKVVVRMVEKRCAWWEMKCAWWEAVVVDDKQCQWLMKMDDVDDGWDGWWWCMMKEDQWWKKRWSKRMVWFSRSGCWWRRERGERWERPLLLYSLTKIWWAGPSNFTSNLATDIPLTDGKCPQSSTLYSCI